MVPGCSGRRIDRVGGWGRGEWWRWNLGISVFLFAGVVDGVRRDGDRADICTRCDNMGSDICARCPWASRCFEEGSGRGGR